MHCPFCQAEDTKVTDSRVVVESNSVRRRRSCELCGERFTTYETVELTLPRVIKRDGSREAFDEHKLRNGLVRALEKRPISTEQIDRAVAAILNQLRAQGDKEIASKDVGAAVMNQLKHLDDVAYVRFASVYRRFKDLEEFRTEIDRMIRGGAAG